MILALASLATAVAAAPATWTLTQSEVRFAIEAPLDVIPGGTRAASGALNLDPDGLAALAQATISVDLSSFRTGIALRDEDLRDQFFEAFKFPRAVLVIGALERPSSPTLTEGTLVEAVATGTLDLHGVQRPVKIPVKLARARDGAGEKIVVNGDFVIPILDHAMQRPQRLVFKLGTEVRVTVKGTFVRALDPAKPPAPVAVATLPPPVVAMPDNKPPSVPKWSFPADSPEGRGERATTSAALGGPGNVMTCRSCHALHDERKGLAAGGVIKPSSTMWNAARRATLWQGLAAGPGEAADICARLFMLREGPLDEAQRKDLEAYLWKIAPDPQPSLHYAAIHLTRKTSVAELEKGDVARGKKLVGLYCADCHEKGKQRPPLEPGLYEKQMIVQRVRRLPGADNLQMPMISMDRLSDGELRDIAAYLGDEKQRIFTRKKK